MSEKKYYYVVTHIDTYSMTISNYVYDDIKLLYDDLMSKGFVYDYNSCKWHLGKTHTVIVEKKEANEIKIERIEDED